MSAIKKEDMAWLATLKSKVIVGIDDERHAIMAVRFYGDVWKLQPRCSWWDGIREGMPQKERGEEVEETVTCARCRWHREHGKDAKKE